MAHNFQQDTPQPFFDALKPGDETRDIVPHEILDAFTLHCSSRQYLARFQATMLLCHQRDPRVNDPQFAHIQEAYRRCLHEMRTGSSPHIVPFELIFIVTLCLSPSTCSRLKLMMIQLAALALTRHEDIPVSVRLLFRMEHRGNQGDPHLAVELEGMPRSREHW